MGTDGTRAERHAGRQRPSSSGPFRRMVGGSHLLLVGFHEKADFVPGLQVQLTLDILLRIGQVKHLLDR